MISGRAAKVLTVLRLAQTSLQAIAIAELVGIAGTHEGKRRTVRRLIEGLRAAGCTIHSSVAQGYWLDAVNPHYQDGRQVSRSAYPGQEPGQGYLWGGREVAQGPRLQPARS